MHIINNHNYEMPYLENYKREKKINIILNLLLYTNIKETKRDKWIIVH